MEVVEEQQRLGRSGGCRPTKVPVAPLLGQQAVTVANRAGAIHDEREQSPRMYPIVFERGTGWQVSYFTGSDGNRTELAQAIVDGRTGELLGAWHDTQLALSSGATSLLYVTGAGDWALGTLCKHSTPRIPRPPTTDRRAFSMCAPGVRRTVGSC